jgi:hypothetical protein
MDFPSTHPVIVGLMVDAGGNTWVGQRRRQEEGIPSLWKVFAPNGVWAADVEVPRGYWITEIGESYILGVWRDNLGVEYVREYSIKKVMKKNGGVHSSKRLECLQYP